MTRARAVLFDLDGTLTDSRLGIFRTTRYAFERLSAARGERFDLPEDSELGWMVGPPLRDSFAKLGGEENVDALIGFYRERYRDIGAFENEVYEGVDKMLAELRASGAQLYVATSKNGRDAERILIHFGLAAYFEAIHGSRDDGGLADKTELIADLIMMRGLSLLETEIAMVGDRKFDVIGARNCGLRAIGALWGYGGADELEAAGADALAHSPKDVCAVATRLFEP